MNINEISGGTLPVSQSHSKKLKDENSVDAIKKDRVDVSSEAKSLFEAEQKKRFDEIQNKIVSGYYSQPEVVARVVDALLKDLG